jgi:hypothetical protein
MTPNVLDSNLDVMGLVFREFGWAVCEVIEDVLMPVVRWLDRAIAKAKGIEPS